MKEVNGFVSRLFVIMGLFAFLVGCGPKPAYKTAAGKQKTKYYNKVQYGIEKNVEPPKSMTKPIKVRKKKAKKKSDN